jgi:fumarate reductase subunit D
MEPVPAPQPWAVAQPTWQAPVVLTDRRDVGAAVVVIAWVVAVLTLGYMLPWAIAATRGKSNHAAVAIVNFFLGWSLIGWVVALVMACTAHRMVGAGVQTTIVVAQQFPQAQFGGPVPQPTVGPMPGWYPSPSGPGQQYWDGSAWTEHRAL